MQTPDSLPIPSTYRSEFAEEAHKLALARVPDDAMARYFAIPLATFHEWLESVPEFARAIHSGRQGDVDVVDRFRQNAMGAAPNKAARAFWLANRLPGEWRAKIEIEAKPGHEDARCIPRAELERLIELAAARGSAAEGDSLTTASNGGARRARPAHPRPRSPTGHCPGLRDGWRR